MKNTKIIKQIAIAIALIGLAVGWRVINFNYHIAPNLEIVTTVSVLAAIILGLRFGIIVPLATMILSDLIIGNSSIFMFTWGAFVIIGLSASLLRKFNKKPAQQIVRSFGFAIASSFVFFVVTNFGVWLQGWYPMTWAGLIDCFIMAIPFYRTMLIGNMILIPAAVSAYQLVRVYVANKESVVDSLVR
jgi:predicted membrane protein